MQKNFFFSLDNFSRIYLYLFFVMHWNRVFLFTKFGLFLVYGQKLPKHLIELEVLCPYWHLGYNIHTSDDEYNSHASDVEYNIHTLDVVYNIHTSDVEYNIHTLDVV